MEPEDQAILEIATQVADCAGAQAENVDTLNDHSDQLQKANLEIKLLKDKNHQLEKKLDCLNAAIIETKEDVKLVKREVLQNSQALKVANLVIEGLPELENENCKKSVVDVLQVADEMFTVKDIMTAYRVGQSSENADFSRPILVKLGDPMIKQKIMENKGRYMKHEQYSKVFLNDDLPPALKRERQIIREIGKRARQLGYTNCKTTASKIILDGKSYRFDELHLLPQNLQMKNIKTREIGDGIGFQGEESFLSNFYSVSFKLEEYTFTSAEQAFFFFKARTCKNEEAALVFLGMSNPRKIKSDGDQIPSKAVWEASKEAFMRSIVYSKFNQNHEIREMLLNTGEAPLYECTRNKWWGCGLRFDSPDWNRGKLPGLNKLGKILMEVRSALRKSVRKEKALYKSPGALIKSVTVLSKQIEKKSNEQLHQGATSDVSNLESNDSSDESLDILPEEEESVGILASSDVSSTSTRSSGGSRKMDITGPDGKVDPEKIRSWSIPRIRKPKRRHSGSYISEKKPNTKHQSTPKNVDKNAPKAHSTPHKKADKSLVLTKVRERLNASKRQRLTAHDKNTSSSSTKK